MNFENSNESGTTLKERDYIGLSEVNSMTMHPKLGCGEAALDLNESAATVLCLGLPVPKPAPQRSNPILEEFRKAQAMKAQQVQMKPATVYHRPRDYETQKSTYPTCFHAPYSVVKNNGVKRGYMETVGKGMASDVKVKWMSNNPYTVQRRTQLVQDAGDSSHKVSNEALKKHSLTEAMEDQPAQNQTVGWPPVRSSFRDNNPVKPVPPPPAAPATACPPSVQEEETPSSTTNSKSCFVKIYMDGVPFGRKVDLKTNNRYEKLYSALEEMFQQFISGHYSAGQTSSSTRTSHFVSSSSSRKLNFLDGSDYVLIYEDHEGDFMLVGDVPWELFVNSVKRLRIMKGSEEVNLAPQNADPLKSQPAVG